MSVIIKMAYGWVVCLFISIEGFYNGVGGVWRYWFSNQGLVISDQGAIGGGVTGLSHRYR